MYIRVFHVTYCYMSHGVLAKFIQGKLMKCESVRMSLCTEIVLYCFVSLANIPCRLNNMKK
jgi:hypothetical protein